VETIDAAALDPSHTDQRPFMYITVNSKPIKWLIDTGAASTVMDAKLFRNTYTGKVLLQPADKTL